MKKNIFALNNDFHVAGHTALATFWICNEARFRKNLQKELKFLNAKRELYSRHVQEYNSFTALCATEWGGAKCNPKVQPTKERGPHRKPVSFDEAPIRGDTSF